MDKFVVIPWVLWGIDLLAFGTLREMQRRGVSALETDLVISYLIGTWITVMIVHGFFSNRFTKYVSKSHPNLWKDISLDVGASRRLVKPLASLEWLMSPNDCGDPHIRVLKRRAKAWIVFVAVVFVTALPMNILLEK